MGEAKDISQLISQAKEGKQKAFNDLLNFFWKEVYLFQLGKCRNEDEAEDITIKTFARAFDKIDTFDEQYQFKTWLFTISNNLFIDQMRKKIFRRYIQSRTSQRTSKTAPRWSIGA